MGRWNARQNSMRARIAAAALGTSVRQMSYEEAVEQMAQEQSKTTHGQSCLLPH